MEFGLSASGRAQVQERGELVELLAHECLGQGSGKEDDGGGDKETEAG